jgi:triphosphoribosyl-dephospho-CoA synthase
MMTGRDIAAAFLVACRAELQALKPGNVHVHAAGHGMTTADFEASAEAAAPHIAAAGEPVGIRILRAVEATRAAVGQNTNLGIVLLAAPLALAAERAAGQDLRPALETVLSALSRQDAAHCFQAIALARPGGLGDAAEQDVRDPPSVTLLEAMRLAAHRDRIAYQYASGFADVFDAGLPVARGAASSAEAAAAVFWHFLTTIPDSHIARKYGVDRAEAVRSLAMQVDAGLRSAANAPARKALLLDFDARLKADGLNPGTTADLTVATLFALRLDVTNLPAPVAV